MCLELSNFSQTCWDQLNESLDEKEREENKLLLWRGRLLSYFELSSSQCTSTEIIEKKITQLVYKDTRKGAGGAFKTLLSLDHHSIRPRYIPWYYRWVIPCIYHPQNTCTTVLISQLLKVFKSTVKADLLHLPCFESTRLSCTTFYKKQCSSQVTWYTSFFLTASHFKAQYFRIICDNILAHYQLWRRRRKKQRHKWLTSKANISSYGEASYVNITSRHHDRQSGRFSVLQLSNSCRGFCF